ncbi:MULTISPECIES: nuclear transport factor 2 family protein [unclassified Rhizobium]|jgi:ketosteroid isomerase-like protein|uniref:YybH family protein n=1 Tax=unclassified Rhizobium TaxID=2613769 RepID=UPI00064915B8|nr:MULTISPECIES: nuclear transport factor 2 family protein [unclassified Rhizobium]MBN8950619.1 nuclear transport factor 2 family protein [Rhizobium tropici]OJY66164.1 MAG: DUF4440 domain-containing protein [Rhizobium sp. 60-20]RKD69282.1 ketosteroid isomerase-like protein [Rhizobium sp. WW_1]
MNPEDHMRLYAEKINLHRFDAVAPLISADAVFWFTDGTYKGTDAIRAAFEDTWKKLNNDIYWLEDIQWIATGESTASCIYRFRWRTSINDKILEGYGRGTTVLRKEAGDWKIIHEHLSRPPVSSASPSLSS